VPFQKRTDSSFVQTTRCVDRQTKLGPNSIRKVAVRSWIKLILKHQRKSALNLTSLIQTFGIIRTTKTGRIPRSYTANLRLQLRIFYIAESILNFDAVHATIALKDKIQIMPVLDHSRPKYRFVFRPCKTTAAVRQTFQDDQFSVTNQLLRPSSGAAYPQSNS